ncbi:MAG: D-glycero-beta-D-manno-heptose-7-phosphate kinase [Burkholderiaceae bacterium]|nr:D-glycero-beta-D-manno-heptose-7-phosphate kinase [Burkholderiaceae bacterium]
MFENVHILVAGDVMLDRYWFGEVTRISPEAPVPVVHVGRREDRLGGAANVARNVAALGSRVGLLGVVGQDEAGDAVTRLLEESAIDSHLRRDPDSSTIIKLRVIGRQQQLLRVDFEEPPTEQVLRDKLAHFADLLPRYDVVLMSDYDKGSMVNVAAMIAAARRAGKLVLVDPKGDDFTRYSGATALTPNKAELRRIVGEWRSENDLTEKAQRLRANLQIEALLLTRSEEGMTLYTESGVTHMPTVAREVFDVSGAGDTVIATLAVMLGAGKPMEEAVALANRAGGVVVGKFGTATVSADEILGD